MTTLVPVWFSPEGAIVCWDCALDYAPARLRPSHVQAGLVECGHCHTIIGGGAAAEPRRVDAGPWGAA